jgi:hypothetical protein
VKKLSKKALKKKELEEMEALLGNIPAAGKEEKKEVKKEVKEDVKGTEGEGKKRKRNKKKK